MAIAAQALGVGQAALEEALRYARGRTAFGQPIGNFQAIQFQLARMANRRRFDAAALKLDAIEADYAFLFAALDP